MKSFRQLLDEARGDSRPEAPASVAEAMKKVGELQVFISKRIIKGKRTPVGVKKAGGEAVANLEKVRNALQKALETGFGD